MTATQTTTADFHSVIAYPLHGNCYLNITSECTLRCGFCPKYKRSWEIQSYDLRLHREPSVAEVLAALGDPTRYQEIVFCGLGEPTVRYPEVLAIARAIKQAGGLVRLNTDGLASLREGRDVSGELAEVIDRASISMNAQNEAVYIQHTRPRLEGAYAAMLDFASRAQQAGIEVTLTAIDGLEGVDVAVCEQIATQRGLKFRRRVLDQVG